MAKFRKINQFALSVLIASGLALAALAGPPARDAAVSALDSFRALKGEWQGTNSKGQPVTVSYQAVADGTAVMEHLSIGGHHDMVTMYHMDGDRLLLTHYCAEGNQPRMVAESVAPGEVRFAFVDATNMSGPDAGHMHRATFKFKGKDRLTAEWTWREAGKDAFTEVIEVQRSGAGVARK